MNTSEKIDQIATSLFAMRKELKQPTADQEADAGSYTYPYLSLPALIEFIDMKGSALSLSYVQEITRDGDGVNVTTRIMHSSGQWIELGPLFLPVKGNAQAWGSAISYGRRYSLAAAFGIAPRGEDDDASKASADVEPAPGHTLRSSPVPVGGSGKAEAGERGGEEPTADDGEASTAGSKPPPQSDAQRTMEQFHPGRPHKLKQSTKAPVKFCEGYDGIRCEYSFESKPKEAA